MKAKFISVGSYVPDKVVLNSHFISSLDTSDEWIRKRTGIVKRHILSGLQATSFMCAEAGSLALIKAEMSPTAIDVIIVATCTPDKTLPSCANLVQKSLKCCNAFSFDVQASCTGFVYALAIANNFIRVGEAKNIMVIGADAMSKIVDWTDRSSCILFGDGAGAFIISSGICDEAGIISTHLFTDAELSDVLSTNGGISTTGDAGKIVMNGKSVFEHAVKKISEVILFTLEKSNFELENVDHFILHQANIRIIDLVAKNLNINVSKMVVTIEEFANTSAASIPISWDKSQEKIKEGNLVMLVAMGAGFNWGSVLIRV